MKITDYRFFLLFVMLLISSCNSDHIFHPIELSIEGIDYVEDNELYLSAEIPKQGKDFHITGIGEYANMIRVSEVIIDGALQNDPSMPITSLNGDWGYFEQKGNTIYFLIASNNSNTKRIIEFTIGYGYWFRYLRLIQESASISN